MEMINLYHENVKDFIARKLGEKDHCQYHALIADPPYHMGGGFMSYEWDKGKITFSTEVWSGFLSLMLPGAFGAVYTSASNYHRVASAIESAGGKIFPMLAWIHSRGIGLGRKFVEHAGYEYGAQALKPAIEPIVLFQKISHDTGEETLKKHGTGSLAIGSSVHKTNTPYTGDKRYKFVKDSDGNWVVRMPSNVLVDRTAAVDGQEFFGETGTWATAIFASIINSERFKYCGKASRSERDAGLDDMEDVRVGVLNARRQGSFVGNVPIGKNDHPTVKPLDLAKWLGGLLLPPEKYQPLKLLNPFSGTGSDAIGAIMAGWRHVDMVEMNDRYVAMTQKRLFHHCGITLELEKG